MSLSLVVITTFGVLLANLFLGLLVFTRNPKSRTNRNFGLMVLFLIGWLATNFFVDRAATTGSALFLTKATNIFATFAAFFFAVFCFKFTNIEQKIKNIKFFNYLIFSITLLMALFVLRGWIVKDVFLKDGIYEIVSGSLINYHLVYFIIIFVIGLGSLIYSFFNLTAFRAQQLKYMIFGLALFIVTALLFSSIIPLFTESYVTVALAPVSSLFFIGFTSYAIIKHRLMDIRMVVARSVSYSLLLLALAGFYTSSIFLVQQYIFKETFKTGYIATQMVIAVIMVFAFQPLRRWINKVTDKVFFKNQYDPETFLDTLSHTISGSIVLIELLYKTLNIIVSEMKITRGMVVVFSDTGHVFTNQSVGYHDAPPMDDEELVHMAKDGLLVYDELPENSRYKHLLRKYEASAAIPIKTNSDTQGLLLLGEKQSGDMFNANDLKVFEIIAPELAVSITNSKSYEKIERFNVTLRQEVKKATGELERKNEQLRELDKAKDEFISMASHQLRTPLTAIKGYLSMLLEGDAGEIRVSQYDFVNEAFQGANRMVGLINDLLNVSRMETGRFFLEPVEVDLDRVINEEIKQLQNHAKEKHLYLKYEKKGKVPTVWADETKLRQVVMNFIDNALYYTTAGGVTVNLYKEGPDVVFEVHDTGIGVPKASQKQLFTKFYRADNARHVRPDGTGLGIYLAKKVVDDHHGKLIFESTEGKGSTFGFRFPIKSKLSTKRMAAPMPNIGAGLTTPAIGELAAGVGVPVNALEATSLPKPVEANVPKNPEEKTATESAKELLREAELVRDDALKK